MIENTASSGHSRATTSTRSRTRSGRSAARGGGSSAGSGFAAPALRLEPSPTVEDLLRETAVGRADRAPLRASAASRGLTPAWPRISRGSNAMISEWTSANLGERQRTSGTRKLAEPHH